MRPSACIIAVTSAFALLPAVAHADVIETGPEVAADVRVASAGDFNGDGRADLAVATPRALGLGLTIVFGRPGLADASVPAEPAAALRISFADVPDTPELAPSPVGDIDGDGYDDLAIARIPVFQTPNQGVGPQAIIRGGASSGAVSHTELGDRMVPLPNAASGGPRLATKLGDIDGDALDDVLINFAYAGSTPCIAPVSESFFGPCAGIRRGPALDRSQRILTSAGTVGFAGPLGDIDGDGLAEVTAGFGGVSGIAFPRVADGDALPAELTTFRDGERYVTTRDAGDVNGDGLADIALAVVEGPATVLYGRAGLAGRALEFAALPGPARPLPAGFHPAGPAGDVNGDGIADLLASSRGGGADRVLLGGASTAPWRAEDALVIPGLDDTDSADVTPVDDVDGDGRDELAVAMFTCDAGTCTRRTVLAGVTTQAPARLQALRVAPAAFRAGAYRPSRLQGTRLTTTLSAAATVRFTLRPLFGGPTRAFDAERPAGTSVLGWDGRVGGAALRPGLYRITASTPAGESATFSRVIVVF